MSFQVNFGDQTWNKLLHRETFLQFYSFVLAESENIGFKLPIYILESLQRNNVAVQVEANKLCDHVFVFCSSVINSKYFLSCARIGLHVCLLLDNDFQTLEIAYELQTVLLRKEELHTDVSFKRCFVLICFI